MRFVILLLIPFILFGCTGNSFSIQCGNIESKVAYRIQGPEQSENFAILLNGSPGTSFFSDTFQKDLEFQQFYTLPASHDPYAEASVQLVLRGYRVLEIKYPETLRRCGYVGVVTGFYSACCAQGLDNVLRHNADLYDRSVQLLGYNHQNPSHRLIGLGQSIGAIQFQTMALMSGKPFNKIALTGFLMGNSREGCLTGRSTSPNGMSWRAFMLHADSLTRSTDGCSQSHNSTLEYTDQYNAENFPFLQASNIGIFEGSDLQGTNLGIISPQGNPDQVQYLVRARTGIASLAATDQLQTVGNTTWKLYPNRGHEILLTTFFQDQGFRPTHPFVDIIRYLTSP